MTFDNAQILLIGEKDPQKALEPEAKKEEQAKETPSEELEKLEEEDEARVQHLRGKRDEPYFGPLLTIRR